MIRKPRPVVLSEAMREAVSKQLNNQTIAVASKSTDPVNFPVFEVPTGKKVLIYVPNHVVVNDGIEELRMDKPLIHVVKDGKRFLYYRCISGIQAEDENGNRIYDGTCPLCDGTEVPWDLANTKIVQRCRQINLDPSDKENDQVKSIRASEFSARVIKEPTRYFTFPIVVIATVNDDGKTIAKDSNGKPILTPMWYSVSEAQYNKKWESCLEGMEEEPSHPGGNFFTLNYAYDTKGKEATKRDSAQNLTVISRKLKGVEKLMELLDKQTEDWTPEKAQETVIRNQLFTMEDLCAITDEVLESPREMLNLLRATDAISSNTSGSATVNTGFNLQANVDTPVKGIESAVAMDSTDEDEDIGTDVSF